MITSTTKILGIIGDPISHSLSPVMQNAALVEAGLDYVYLAFHVRPADLLSAVDGLRSLGVAGFNVTIPHKEAIIPFLDRIEGDAAVMGSVNVVKRDGDRLIGYNTDGIGFIRSLRVDLGVDPMGKRAVILGAGGAARGGAFALAAAGVSHITIVNRTVSRGELLATELAESFPKTQVFVAASDDKRVGNELSASDLLVNTTSVGMKNVGTHEFDLSGLSSRTAVYDMVYIPAETELLRHARSRGCRTANGTGMLAGQGEEAFLLWSGVAAPEGIMRKTLDRHLARTC